MPRMRPLLTSCQLRTVALVSKVKDLVLDIVLELRLGRGGGGPAANPQDPPAGRRPGAYVPSAADFIRAGPTKGRASKPKMPRQSRQNDLNERRVCQVIRMETNKC